MEFTKAKVKVVMFENDDVIVCASCKNKNGSELCGGKPSRGNGHNNDNAN